MNSLANMDMNGIEGQMGGGAVIPAGTYRCVFSEGNQKNTKSGTGQYLELKLDIQQGEFAGAKLTHRLNLWNPNTTAMRIAKQEYKYILDNLGLRVEQVQDASQMCNIPIDIKVVVRPYKKNDGTEGEQNEIVDFIQVGYANTQQQSQQAQQQNQNNQAQQQSAQRPY